ncbi:hypothetical protein [Escherichia coli]|uniref:Uncharacterized protein n=1 Tax=Escherichia phage 18-1-2 TaxID=2883041 RepID=A0A8K1QNR6_9CAUD|nr:hypothetical protein [Escherichia coli]UDW09951.1 hypothetical protein [Escherichia phage 18-1-2]UJQ87357.1 hypothetical protein [Escherichia phage 24-2-1]UJQ87572.1 hypothetical protein [Escherichia phage 19-1-2]UOX40167.1 hypothetical protein [Escherichia phage vB_EcoM_TH18]
MMWWLENVASPIVIFIDNWYLLLSILSFLLSSVCLGVYLKKVDETVRYVVFLLLLGTAFVTVAGPLFITLAVMLLPIIFTFWICLVGIYVVALMVKKVLGEKR